MTPILPLHVRGPSDHRGLPDDRSWTARLGRPQGRGRRSLDSLTRSFSGEGDRIRTRNPQLGNVMDSVHGVLLGPLACGSVHQFPTPPTASVAIGARPTIDRPISRLQMWQPSLEVSASISADLGNPN